MGEGDLEGSDPMPEDGDLDAPGRSAESAPIFSSDDAETFGGEEQDISAVKGLSFEFIVLESFKSIFIALNSGVGTRCRV